MGSCVGSCVVDEGAGVVGSWVGACVGTTGAGACVTSPYGAVGSGSCSITVGVGAGAGLDQGGLDVELDELEELDEALVEEELSVTVPESP